MIAGEPWEQVNGIPLTTYSGVNGAKCHLVHTEAEWDAVFELLMQQKKVAFDTETTGFEYYLDKHIIGFSFGWGIENFYVATRHEDSVLGGKQETQVPFAHLLLDLSAFFAQQDVTTIYFNAKFDKHFLLKEGIVDNTHTRDASLFWALYDENAPGKLKVISSGWKDMFGRPQKGVVHKDAAKDEKIIDKWRADEARARQKVYKDAISIRVEELHNLIEHQDKSILAIKRLAKAELANHPYADACKSAVHYGFVPLTMMAKYAGLDTYLTWEVFHYTVENIQWNEKLVALITQEHELTEALLDIEERGALIDRGCLISAGEKLEVEISKLHAEIVHSFGMTNPNSNAQLVCALITRGVQLTEHTAASTGCMACAEGSCSAHYSVASNVLAKLVQRHPDLQLILDYRAKTKLKGTYVDSILDKITQDNILHCSFRQNVSTGRMSASDPNLQNIPRKDTTIRAAFIVPEDYVFVFADYSQIEVRMTAHYSEDPALLRAYAEGMDLHLATMCAMFRYDYKYASEIYFKADGSDSMFKKIKELRNVAKVLNFATIYGVSAVGLSEQIPRPESMREYSQKRWIKECESFLDAYLYGYLGVKKLMNRCGREAKQKGYLTNSFGRIRHLPHANACQYTGDPQLSWMERKAKRQSTNSLIQGECADLFKAAVVRVHKLLREHKSNIVNLVHDEIQMYIHKDELYLVNEVRRVMEDFHYKVDLIAEFECSQTSWADKKKFS